MISKDFLGSSNLTKTQTDYIYKKKIGIIGKY